MKYDHYLVEAWCWVRGVLPDGTDQILAPPAEAGPLITPMRSNAHPLALPGQKVWTTRSSKLHVVYGVYWEPRAGYRYRVVSQPWNEDYYAGEIITLCS